MSGREGGTGTMGQAVLIVEDEEMLARNMSMYLSRRGFDVRWAASGELALRELETFKPDAVLLDLNMDGMSGLEALGRIKALDPQMPVVIITGNGEVKTAV